MSYADDAFYPEQFTIASDASVNARADFITKTYLHLAGAVAAFIGLEAAILNSELSITITNLLLGNGIIGSLLVFGAFMMAIMQASRMALSQSQGVQYAGLGLAIVAYGILFTPLLTIASQFAPEAIPTAALMTLIVFSGLTGVVFATRKNFSFLGPALTVGSFALIGAIVLSMFFNGGVVFIAGAGVVLMAGYILYETSNVLHNYHIGQHVGAALQLFCSVAMMFYYILMLVLSFSGRD